MSSKTPTPAPAQRAKHPTVPLALLAIGIGLTTLVLSFTGLVNALPSGLSTFFGDFFWVLLLIDGWLVIIGGIWLVILAFQKLSQRRQISPTKKDRLLAGCVAGLLAIYALGSFFVYSAGQAIINLLLFGLAVAIIVFIVSD